MPQRADLRRATSSSGPRRNRIATPTWADEIFGKHNRRLALHRLHWPHWAAIGLILAFAAGCLMAGADKLALVEAAAAVGYLLTWLFRPIGRSR
jgi:hypothetical protein